jgi:hypothetical protein
MHKSYSSFGSGCIGVVARDILVLLVLLDLNNHSLPCLYDIGTLDVTLYIVVYVEGEG